MPYNIEKFASSFVRNRWRSRFMHEFLKKPHDLMQRCIGNWQQIFFKEALHQTRPLGFDEEIVRVIDWGGVLEEMNWADFLRDYPKDHAGFIAVGRSGNLGFLETHEDHPKLSKHYYIYSI